MSELITVDVDLGDRSYPILISEKLFETEQSSLTLKTVAPNKKFYVVTNESIAPLYLQQLKDFLGDGCIGESILPDGEQYKNLETLQRIFDGLLKQQCDRGVVLVALGGGVIGDMTGFAAACYQRGVSFIQVPTTLLAQVDSSVGGKTGVNHPLGKNMIGAFHQPLAVFIDTEMLSTLPPREYAAGLAEVIKYGFICDKPFLQWIESNVDLLVERDTKALAYAIEQSCLAKARVVEQDEKESGLRAILNFGHTFGHAIETATHYSTYLHGEAVAIGMAIALDMSARLNLIHSEDAERYSRLIANLSLPVSLSSGELTPKQALALMGHDKKVLDGTVRLVLLKELGEAFVSSDYDRDVLAETLDSACVA